jgi:NADPH:quinone reductase-like Zn-dependent oxidoreductase
MMRLTPSGDVLGEIARLLEQGTIRPDVASVYALQDAAEAWKDMAGNQSKHKSHGKIVLQVA